MQYVALIEGEERQVEVKETKPGHFVVTVEGRELKVDAVSLAKTEDGDDASLSLLIDGISLHAQLHRQDRTVHTSIGRCKAAVDILDLRRRRLQKARQESAQDEGPVKILAPMPGKVVSVSVCVGDQVSAGQGVMVVEAMKMENELRSPRAGVVQAIEAIVGQAVECGAVLCVVQS